MRKVASTAWNLINTITLKLCGFLMCSIWAMVSAQTTVNGGQLTGKLSASGSPYLITSTIEVPTGKTLTIEPGVELLFNDSCNLHVYGSIQAQGTKTEPIRFSARDTNYGWKGIHLFENAENADSNLFEHCEFSYTHQITQDIWKDYGALFLDSVTNVRVSNCTFNKNTAYYAAAIRALFSDLKISNCQFQNNTALDTNSKLEKNGNGPVGSCIMSHESKLHITESFFENNKTIAPNYPEDRSRLVRIQAMIFILGNKVSINNCHFYNNYTENEGLITYQGTQWDKVRHDTVSFRGCDFRNNSTSDGYILELNGESQKYTRFILKNCRLENNYSLNKGKGTVVLCYNRHLGSNRVSIENCTLFNNDLRTGIISHEGSFLNIINTTIQGQQGAAFEVDRNAETNVKNCIITNNWLGVVSYFNSELDLYNSVIAYNGRIDTSVPYPILYPTGKAFAMSGGVVVDHRGKINLYNSIVTDNRGHLGHMANMFGYDNRTIFPGEVYNTILEGGIDSTYRQALNDPWFKTGNMPFEKIVALDSMKFDFINPPKGVGVDYASTDLDFRIKEDCDSLSPVFNKGTNVIPGKLSWQWIPKTDAQGRTRVLCGQMDIGPYEAKGPKGYTYLERPWEDDTLCSDKLHFFSPSVCGYDVDYTWQTSADGSSWTDLPITAFEENRLLKPTEQTYRLITTQQDCNVLDTFGPAQLTIYEAPKPDLGNDTLLHKNETLWLSPGEGFDTYRWNITGTQDTAHRFVDGGRFSVLKSRVFWVEVTATNGCIARDSITIQFKDWNSSLEDIATKGIVIYPNPTSDKLYINLPDHWQDEMIVRVVDQLGKFNCQQSLSAEATAKTEIDLSHLPPGVYTLQLEINGELLSKKFIKN